MKTYGQEYTHGEPLDWNIEKMRQKANEAFKTRAGGHGSKKITISEISARRDKKGIPQIIIAYFDHTTGRDWTKSASLYCDEGMWIANAIQVGKTYEFTSERQPNGFWVWMKIDEVVS